MYQFTIGFIAGVYIGTHYNCKPLITDISEYIKKRLPDEKNPDE